jgi:predicted AlkP superfamily phosphohydrolase/phosphomutase
VNLIQLNRLRTSFVHSSSWIRIEKEGRKQRYRVKKEEEEKYIENILAMYCKNKKPNQEARATTLSLRKR